MDLRCLKSLIKQHIGGCKFKDNKDYKDDRDIKDNRDIKD